MPWRDLERELDLWASLGRRATFWWRDDDGGALTAAMDRLLRLANDTQVAPALAVIPEDATAALAAAVGGDVRVKVFQHGFRHHNHRRCNSKASEFPAHRDTDAVARELSAGWERLQQLFASQAEPVLVPPWGHIAESMLGALQGWGFRGLSRFGPRAVAAIPALRQVNAHCDLIKWRPEPHFRGEAKCLWHLVNHLQGRRRGTMDPDEPTGVLTHAYDMDTACYAFLKDLFGLTFEHSASEWLQPRDVFGSLATEHRT